MKRVVRILVLFLLLCISFRQAAMIRDLSPTVSLRFDSEFSYEQAQGFDAVWTEEQAYVSGCQCTLIRFDGDALLAFPAEYAFGAPPNCLTPDFCAVSSQLAWELFGGEDVTGLVVELHGEEYTICGVLAHAEPVILVPDNKAFTAAELCVPSLETDLYRYAADCAAQVGMPEPTQILCGPESALLAGLLPWLCVLLVAWKLFCRIGHRPAALWLALILILLAVIPDWVIPTRWSDTFFWSELAQSLFSRFQSWLSLPPALKDIPVKLAWFKMGAAIITSYTFVNRIQNRLSFHPTARS